MQGHEAIMVTLFRVNHSTTHASSDPLLWNGLPGNSCFNPRAQLLLRAPSLLLALLII